MADEAFALSPISARPSPPSEADYEAIREAFAETARGRWFLNEYARRNRNADTSMVLDAVARIEETIAARTLPPIADSRESFDLIKARVAHARAEAVTALASADRDAALASARKGARVIREIAWSLRETGTDPRICNILDGQIAAIEALHVMADDEGPREAVAAIFDALLAQIGALAGDDTPSQTAEAATSSIEATAPQQPIAALDDDLEWHAAPEDAPASQADSNSAMEMTANQSPDSFEASLAPTDVELAEDDAVLDLIAMEMSAPDDDDHTTDDGEDDHVDIVALKNLAPTVAPAPVDHTPSLQPSLGAALLANGIIRRPASSGVDPFAPIRRMSQAEKVAFFS